MEYIANRQEKGNPDGLLFLDPCMKLKKLNTLVLRYAFF